MGRAQRGGKPLPLLATVRQPEAQQVGSEVERTNQDAAAEQARESLASIPSARQAKQRCAARKLEAARLQQAIESPCRFSQRVSLAICPAPVGVRGQARCEGIARHWPFAE